MIHPYYWSLYSLRNKAHKQNVKEKDLRAYSLLPVKGKVVLDLGAFNGDTAFFFLKRGARKVIAVEPVKRYCDIIRSLHFRDLELRERKATKCDLLSNDYDVCKCDIEGYESEFLDLFTRPTVIEYHNYWIKDQLLNRGFRGVELISHPNAMLGIGLMVNF